MSVPWQGWPTSPESDGHAVPGDIDILMARFDDTPAGDHHVEMFIQDGGDDDDFYEWSRSLHDLTEG